ncbi:hypothetical protein ABFT23_01230 [Nocardioides sp. C4-1]|uniref:hypothetical protein n=1 Tax=Nocardioides sp. C4-1 TaxID=3151851 RepID=UPI003263A9C4
MRGADVIDVVTSDARDDVVDVLVADHAPSSVVEPLLGRDMIRIEGGTQALRRTVEARLEIESRAVSISVPRPIGALILKAAAYRTDNRDRERHLADAAALLACIDDPFAEREGFAGSDRGRLMALQRALTDDHVVWLALPDRARRDGRAALRVLCQR